MTEENTLTKGTDPATGPEHTRSVQCYRPQVDILEQKNELLLRADVPGARADQIDVHFEDGTLTLRATVPPRQPNEQRFLLREYGVGDFCRTFRVSESIDAGKISAEYQDGVLTLRLPKVEAVKPRKIAVKS
jgi:HSP20 family protein